jgi:hypothetical protein
MPGQQKREKSYRWNKVSPCVDIATSVNDGLRSSCVWTILCRIIAAAVVQRCHTFVLQQHNEVRRRRSTKPDDLQATSQRNGCRRSESWLECSERCQRTMLGPPGVLMQAGLSRIEASTSLCFPACHEPMQHRSIKANGYNCQKRNSPTSRSFSQGRTHFLRSGLLTVNRHCVAPDCRMALQYARHTKVHAN